MGYKLAGMNVVGINEIDPRMAKTYLLNMKPKHVFLEPIQEFKQSKSFPPELMNLDILDGSPPCSTFSMAGVREDAWGKKKKFREGQAEQVLDRLFFDFLDLAERLKPKVIVAENVKGMLAGNARGYCQAILERMRHIGYSPQLFLLNAAFMGVPQARERVFFLAVRSDLNKPKLVLDFKEKTITPEEAFVGLPTDLAGTEMTAQTLARWKRVKPGQSIATVHPTGSCFNHQKLHPRRPSQTIDATSPVYHWNEPRSISRGEFIRLSSFPDDYRTSTQRLSDIRYVCGMSVPPRMIERIAVQIREQWLS